MSILISNPSVAISKALLEGDVLAPQSRTTMAPLPSSVVDVERAVIGSSDNVRRAMTDALNRMAPQDVQKLLDVTQFTHADIEVLGAIYVAGREDDVQRTAQEGPINRLKFDPSSLSDVAALLSAIAALNLSRTVGAQMQGMFAQLAYAAALAQGAATVAAAKKDMDAAITGAVFAIGMATAGAGLQLHGQALNHKNIKGNLVEANQLKAKVADDRATLNSPSPRTPDAPAPGVANKAKSSRAADVNKLDKDAALRNVDKTHADVQQQTEKVHAAEAKVKDVEADLNKADVELQAREKKVLELERKNTLATTEQQQLQAQELAKARELRDAAKINHSELKEQFKAVTGELKQARIDLAQAQVDLAGAKVDLAEVDVRLAGGKVTQLEKKIDTGTRRIDELDADLLAKDQRIGELEVTRDASTGVRRDQLDHQVTELRADRDRVAVERDAQQLQLDQVKVELGQAKVDLADKKVQLQHAEQQLTLAQQQLATLQVLNTLATNIDESRLLTDDEKAVLGGPIREMEARINLLEINAQLNRKKIDGFLTAGQALSTVAQAVAAMTGAMVRVQSAVYTAESSVRAAEAGIDRATSEAMTQTVAETTSMINKITDTVDALQRARAEIVAQIANARA